MDLCGFSSSSFEAQPLTKTCPPSWGVGPRTSEEHLSETLSRPSLDLLPEFYSQLFQSREPAKKLAWHYLNSSSNEPQDQTFDFTRDQTLHETHKETEPEETRVPRLSPRVPLLNPVVLLSQLHPRLSFRSVCERPHGGAFRSSVVLLELEGRVFEGCGRSKGAAKARAAAFALHALHGVSLRSGMSFDPRSSLRRDTGQRLPQVFAESVSRLVTEKFTELSLSSPDVLAHKGLAGIVLTTGLNLRSAQVVAIATGTKYNSMDGEEDDGLTVRDCHAEVLCRKALLRFFYDQLELLLRSPSDAKAWSIFVPAPGGGAVSRLRDHVHLHMFLSCPPCGDARLHWPHHGTVHKRTALSRRWQCGVRVKVNGEGTVPLSTQPVQRHRASLSCTDKLAKWCVVGLQGALLSHLVEPVYLHSVTIATHVPSGHMHRVMWRRLARVKELQFPFRRRLFLLSCVDPCHFPARAQGAHRSMSWTYGQDSEVLSVQTGLQARSESPSRLCPHSMFLRWAQIYMQISGEDVSTTTVTELKLAAVSYQRALGHYRRWIEEAGLQKAGL